MSSIEEMDEIKKKLREIPALALIDNLNELLEEEDISIDVLRLFRDEMIRRKFNSPFGFLVNVSKAEEDGDAKKQNSYFRKIATLKKYALFSTMVSIASRKLRDAVKRNNYNDLIPFIPINGNYLSNILQYGYVGLINYRSLYDIIKNTGEAKEGYLYEIKGENYVYRKKVQSNKDIKNIIKEGEEIIGSKKVPIIKPLIKSRFVLKALCSSIVGYAGFISFKKAENGLSEQLKKYNEILKRRGYVPFYIVDNYLKVDKSLYSELNDNAFLENGKVRDEIKAEILRKRKDIKQNMEKISKLMLVVPIAKHYLLKNKLQRKVNPLYPSLMIEPSEKSLEVLNIANNYLPFPLKEVVVEKISYEEYGDNKTIALAIVGKKYGIKNSSEFFGVEEGEVVKAINEFSRMQSGRGRDFLDKLKD